MPFSFYKRLKLAAASVALLASHTAMALPVSFSGELTDSDPSFYRPIDLASQTITRMTVAYDVFAFHVTANGEYSIRTTAAKFIYGGLVGDTFLVLYANAFDSSSPLANLIELNDDEDAQNKLSLITTLLQADIQYYLVVTSYNYSDRGTYAGVFNTNNTGQVVLGELGEPGEVPEPASLALLALAALGMKHARNRRCA